MPYKPHPKSEKILDYAMAKIKSVPYKVSARWVFYQLVQVGLINKKKSDTFDKLLSRARKNFYKGWSPNLLADTIRECYFKGEGFYSFDLKLDSITEQDVYVQLWFEAEAMHEQFEYYTKDYRVSLVPFRGDVSIPIKWKIAKKIDEMSQHYMKPVQILYFGDYDLKGVQIYEAALKDIMAWTQTPFSIERVGLTLEQAKEFNIPENPLKPGTYQWEALNDEQAGNIILTALKKYQRKMSPSLQKREAALREQIIHNIQDILKNEKKE